MRRLWPLHRVAPIALLFLLHACGSSGNFDRAEAERVLGAVEIPVGAFVAELFVHFEELPPINVALDFGDDGGFSGEVGGAQGGNAQATGQASYEPEIELTPAQLETSFSLTLNAYAVTGLVLDGALTVAYSGDRQTFVRTITGELTVGGELDGTLSIDLTLTDLGRRRVWTGTLGQYVYDARTSY